MRSVEDVELVLRLVATGLSDYEIARRTGVPRATVGRWRHGAIPGPAGLREGRSCAACGQPEHVFAALPASDYSYLLGLYLGDGNIARHRGGVYRLVVTLDLRYPGIIGSCARAMERVIGRPAGLAAQPGCTRVSTYSKSWPCLFPQHGPGRKHERAIVLTDWQQAIIAEHPEPLLRGLIHSDGWRGTNRVTVGGKRYAYPRYQFSNASDDIRRIFCDACDAIGVEWRRMNARNVSVAKRGSVARLDEFIGPKA